MQIIWAKLGIFQTLTISSLPASFSLPLNSSLVYPSVESKRSSFISVCFIQNDPLSLLLLLSGEVPAFSQKLPIRGCPLDRVRKIQKRRKGVVWWCTRDSLSHVSQSSDC